MAVQFDVEEAAAILDELLDRACAGEEIILAQGGVPMVQIVPYEIEIVEPSPSSASA